MSRGRRGCRRRGERRCRCVGGRVATVVITGAGTVAAIVITRHRDMDFRPANGVPISGRIESPVYGYANRPARCLAFIVFH